MPFVLSLFSQTLLLFVQQYYSNTIDLPQEVLVDVDINKKSKLEAWLSDLKKTKVKIFKPIRGEKK